MIRRIQIFQSLKRLCPIPLPGYDQCFTIILYEILLQVGHQRNVKVPATHNVIEEINRQTSNYQVCYTYFSFKLILSFSTIYKGNSDYAYQWPEAEFMSVDKHRYLSWFFVQLSLYLSTCLVSTYQSTYLPIYWSLSLSALMSLFAVDPVSQYQTYLRL